MKKYAYENADGTVGVIQCKGSPESFLPAGATLKNEITGSNPEPSSRYFRDCWAVDGNGDLEVDLTKARAQKMAEVRAKRDGMLKQSDDMWVKNASMAASNTDVEADKTTLRDMTTQAQTDVDALSDADSIESHDAFSGLSLNETYD